MNTLRKERCDLVLIKRIAPIIAIFAKAYPTLNVRKKMSANLGLGDQTPESLGYSIVRGIG
jgi:hypothetical protein